MRGFFSAGALQCLLDHNINIPYIIGISSGSLNAVGFVCCNIEDLFASAKGTGKGLFHLENLVHLEKGILNTDRFFQPARHGYDQLMQSDAVLKIGATRAADAKLVYFEKQGFSSPDDLVGKLKASAAIPVLMPKTSVQGSVYVDGGIIDSIPVEEAIRDGKTKHVVIVTRPKGYRKWPQKLDYFLRTWLRPYPELKQAILTRHIRYNQTMELIERMESSGNALIIRPFVNHLGRTEYNLQKFRTTYEDGYRITLEKMREIQQLSGINVTAMPVQRKKLAGLFPANENRFV